MKWFHAVLSFMLSFSMTIPPGFSWNQLAPLSYEDPIAKAIDSIHFLSKTKRAHKFIPAQGSGILKVQVIPTVLESEHSHYLIALLQKKDEGHIFFIVELFPNGSTLNHWKEESCTESDFNNRDWMLQRVQEKCSDAVYKVFFAFYSLESSQQSVQPILQQETTQTAVLPHISPLDLIKPVSSAIREKLLSEKERTGLTQEEIAAQAHISPKTVQALLDLSQSVSMGPGPLKKVEQALEEMSSLPSRAQLETLLVNLMETAQKSGRSISELSKGSKKDYTTSLKIIKKNASRIERGEKPTFIPSRKFLEKLLEIVEKSIQTPSPQEMIATIKAAINVVEEIEIPRFVLGNFLGLSKNLIGSIARDELKNPAAKNLPFLRQAYQTLLDNTPNKDNKSLPETFAHMTTEEKKQWSSQFFILEKYPEESKRIERGEKPTFIPSRKFLEKLLEIVEKSIQTPSPQEMIATIKAAINVVEEIEIPRFVLGNFLGLSKNLIGSIARDELKNPAAKNLPFLRQAYQTLLDNTPNKDNKSLPETFAHMTTEEKKQWSSQFFILEKLSEKSKQINQQRSDSSPVMLEEQLNQWKKGNDICSGLARSHFSREGPQASKDCYQPHVSRAHSTT
jgi:transcriptional regulator with XRE-family HTH domain